MSVAAQTLAPPSRTLMLMEGRAISELGAFLGALPLLSLAPRGDGHPVLVLPGLVASDTSTRPLRAFLRTRGYAVSGWRQGRNLGLRPGVEADMLDLGRVFNAPKWKIFVKIRIPNALPYILSALKITATAAVVGAIVGEFVASQKGLGYVIVTTQSSMNTSVAFASLIWISVVGLVLYGLVVLAAKLWAPWADGID